MESNGKCREWNPKIPNKLESIQIASKWLNWCCVGPNRLEMLWNGLVSTEWLSNMEIGFEFGSAGPIWIRLLFVSPDPNFNKVML